MKAYACVYRRKRASPAEMRQTRAAALTDQLLSEFLDAYPAPECYLDWGDDPSFFCATRKLGGIRAASWGVCRRDVRASLSTGDFVVFFCGQQSGNAHTHWNYFYVGVGTVGGRYSRQELWTRDDLEPYREFYNVLARWSNGELSWYEKFHPPHANWRERAASPYIVFDRELSDFNVSNPLHVATYDGAIPERWHLENPRVERIHRLLFHGRSDRNKLLRTSQTGYGHAKLNLQGPRSIWHVRPPLEEIRMELLGLVRVAA